MAGEETGRIRTIAFVGQGGAGKTQLAEAALFTAGAITRLGRPDDGSASLDFEPEELNHRASISSAFHHLSWKRHTIIIADTPGYSAFLPDAFNTMRAVDGLVYVVSGAGDIKVEAEKLWDAAVALELPAVAFISRLDRERTSYNGALEAMQKALSVRTAPLTLPLGAENEFAGVIDLISMKVLRYPDAGGKPKEEDLTPDLAGTASAARAALCEAVAESDDGLLEKYLEQGDLTSDELRSGLRIATRNRQVLPVLCGSGAKNIGLGPLLDAVVELLPGPEDRKPQRGFNNAGEEVERKPDPAAPFAALVFKTVADPFAGKLSIFRVVSGKAQSDTTVLNATRQTKERFGQLLRLEGKRQVPLSVAVPGDIAAVAKLKDTLTGDTLCDEKAALILPPLAHPNPVISFAIRPKSKGDEEKASQALLRMIEEDPALEMRRDPQTHEILLAGTGQLHIEVAVERLKRKYNVEVELQAPKVPYKETIKGRSEAQGKYKRQSGGRGQYGDCWLRVEPTARGSGFEFEDGVVGGSVPRQFIPSVEKGIRNTLPEGILAGYPTVDLKVTLYDGSSHPVDSSDMSFQIAASMGLKTALEKAKPVLLEPIMSVEVTCPGECMGEVIGDLNSRRGKVLGVESKGPHEVIKAMVPMAEILKYAPDLRSLTSGRGGFDAQFAHYEEVPGPIAERIIKEANEVRANRGHAHA